MNDPKQEQLLHVYNRDAEIKNITLSTPINTNSRSAMLFPYLSSITVTYILINNMKFENSHLSLNFPKDPILKLLVWKRIR